MNPAGTAVVAFLLVAGGTVFLAMVVESVRRTLNRRSLASRLESFERTVGPEEGSLNVLREQDTLPAMLQAFAARSPRLCDIGFMIEQADLDWSVQKFLTLTLGFGVGFGIATLVLTSNLLFAIIAAAIGGFAPSVHVRRKRAKRMRRFEELLPEAIDLMGRALRAGHPFVAGLKLVADEGADPVASEFRRVFEEQRFGVPIPDALLALAERVPLMDVRMCITAVLIQRDVGGNLAEILDKLSYTIRERFKIRREIRTRTAQGRMTGYLLTALPFGFGLAVTVINPSYLKPLFFEPAGHFLIATAFVLQVIGFIWIKKIVDIDI